MAKVITWELKGFRNTLGRFTKGTRQARRISRDLARTTARMLVKEMKKLAPVGTHYVISDDGTVTELVPATLQKSISFRTFNRTWGIEVRFYAADYVKYVIEPTRPHLIEAKNAKFLRFYWPDAPAEIVEAFGGNVVYFKRVFHPGSKGNPFPERALLSLTPKIQHEAQKASVRIKDIIEIG